MREDEETNAHWREKVKNWCCWHWKVDGGCTRGDKCNFSHDPKKTHGHVLMNTV